MPIARTRKTNVRRAVALSGVLLAVTFAASGQQKSKPVERKADLVNGREVFLKHCASCHGKDGKGQGPAASAMRTPPADLTTLAKRFEGKYPRGYVSAVLNFGKGLASHGSEDMPVWGVRFRSLDPEHDPNGQHHLTDVVAYLASVQSK